MQFDSVVAAALVAVVTCMCAQMQLYLMHMASFTVLERVGFWTFAVLAQL